MTDATNILVLNWGYTMKMVSFYEVVRRTAKTVWIARLPVKETDTDLCMGTMVPIIADREGSLVTFRASLRKNANGEIRYVSKLDHNMTMTLKPWDGTPQHYNYID